MWLGDTVHVGFLRAALTIPGARSLKERRRVVVSLRDRIRSRFDVSCHEVSGHDHPASAALLVTTGGTDPTLLRTTLDKIRALVESSGDCVVVDLLIEVRAWPDPERWREE